MQADLCGSIQMPQFYLLSGYCLTLSYGRTHSQETIPSQPSLFQTLHFYQNRFARIGPIYYLANFLSYLLGDTPTHLLLLINNVLKPVDLGGNFWFRAILTLTATNSWTFLSLGHPSLMPFNTQSWTVTTLSFFYLVFPFLLPSLQSLSTSRLCSLIVFLHHLQSLPCLLSIYLSTTPTDLTWSTTAHPVSRLPVFLMGISAGILRLRGKEGFLIGRRWIHDWIPWGLWVASESHTRYRRLVKKRVKKNYLLKLKTKSEGVPEKT